MGKRQGRCPECAWDFNLDENFEGLTQTGRYEPKLEPHQNLFSQVDCPGAGEEPTVLHPTESEEEELCIGAQYQVGDDKAAKEIDSLRRELGDETIDGLLRYLSA